MRIRVRGDSGTLRSSLSFSTSGLIHGTLLMLLVLGDTSPREPKPKSIYDELIRPHEKQLVWYKAPDRLPDISPAASSPDHRPLRAMRVAPQRIIAGPRDDG